MKFYDEDFKKNKKENMNQTFTSTKKVSHFKDGENFKEEELIFNFNDLYFYEEGLALSCDGQVLEKNKDYIFASFDYIRGREKAYGSIYLLKNEKTLKLNGFIEAKAHIARQKITANLLNTLYNNLKSQILEQIKNNKY